MDTTKIAVRVPSPLRGDDGEAVSVTLKTNTSAEEKTLEKPRDAGWFVAVVRCNCEQRIADSIRIQLHENDIWFESWIPMRKVVQVNERTKKQKVTERPFLSTFIFCHVGRLQLDHIRFRSDVYKMLTMPGESKIYQIPDTVLENYRHFIERAEVPVTPQVTPLKKGQRVRITKGNMMGVEAYVQRFTGKKAVIGNEIKYVSGATIEIDRTCLEVIADEK